MLYGVCLWFNIIVESPVPPVFCAGTHQVELLAAGMASMARNSCINKVLLAKLRM